MQTSKFGIYIVLMIFLNTALVFGGEPPFQLPSQKVLSTLKSAVIYTNKGELYFELFPEDAPWHVANFKYLADKGWYRNTKFHIFSPNYIIQGGAPNNNPEGGPGYSLPPEFNVHKNINGSLGMARMPSFMNPGRRSHGSQFHILMMENPRMDGNYTVFGQLTKGTMVLSNLQRGDIIHDIKVFVRR
jgi:peptidyl-prolyl cis-trans isomerase B (cyclophilin B)